LPTTSIPDVGIGDKISHFLAYFGLSILVNLTFQFQDKYQKLKNKHHLFTIITVAVYGLFDELHQLLIPGRFCAFDDWVANILGGVTGILFLILLKKFDAAYFSK
jgi:VanZ family protein